jgi:RNA polymerase subunit RPABC4/transcription elongation factor Spt4
MPTTNPTTTTTTDNTSKKTCIICEKTYDESKMPKELIHHEYCPECMKNEFGRNWEDLTLWEEDNEALGFKGKKTK